MVTGAKMLNVSEILEFMYCPAKLYLKYARDFDVQRSEVITGKAVHEARRGFEEIIKHNIWNIEKDMEIAEIQKSVLQGVPEFVEELQLKYLENSKV